MWVKQEPDEPREPPIAPGAPPAEAAAPPPSAVKAPALPRPSRKTLGEFVFQLVTITAGILIALAIDGVVESRRERDLVREAHTAISREIADNLRELESTLPSLERHVRNLEQAQRFATELMNTGKTSINELQFGVTLPSLNRASWQTAERTGALGYMHYDDVRAYSEVYEHQQFVLESQRQLVAGLSGLTAILALGPGGDPTRSRPDDLDLFRRRAGEALAATKIHAELARQLAEAYKRVPAR